MILCVYDCGIVFRRFITMFPFCVKSGWPIGQCAEDHLGAYNPIHGPLHPCVDSPSLPRKCQAGWILFPTPTLHMSSNCIALNAIFPKKMIVFYSNSSVSGWIPMIRFHFLNAAQPSPLAKPASEELLPFSPNLTNAFSDRTWSTFLSHRPINHNFYQFLSPKFFPTTSDFLGKSPWVPPRAGSGAGAYKNTDCRNDKTGMIQKHPASRNSGYPLVN